MTKINPKTTNLKTQRARSLRNNMTDAERHLWQHLRNKQLNGHKFRRQFPIGNYIVDFICLDARLIIELDGGQHAENQTYDQKRDQWLKDQGFHILRFWNNNVLSQTNAIIEKVLGNLEAVPSS